MYTYKNDTKNEAKRLIIQRVLMDGGGTMYFVQLLLNIFANIGKIEVEIYRGSVRPIFFL